MMIAAKILKFAPVCHNFVKACLRLDDNTHSIIWSLVAKDEMGNPVFAKGDTVAYKPGPQRLYKGHEVRGTIYANSPNMTDLDLNDAEDWGLT